MEKYAANMMSQAARTGDKAALQQKAAEMEGYKEMYKIAQNPARTS